jgi:hypothetical protein
MPNMELEVERQVVLPGEELVGLVRLDSHRSEQVRLSLHGEEAYRIFLGRDTVSNVFEQTTLVDCTGGEGHFRIPLPPNLNPSYSSEALRCVYSLKVVPKKAGMFANIVPEHIPHMSLTVAPATVEYETAHHTLLLESDTMKLEVMLDQVSLEAGESLTGTFLLTRGDDGALPKNLVFSLALIEECEAKSHRKVLWRLESSVQPGMDMSYPLSGSFEFPIASDSPNTGTWATFRVHAGFRFRVEWGDREQRESVPIQIFHRIVPIEPSRNLFTEK